QELMQPEGDRSFKGIEAGIEALLQATDRPIIVKETGAGISGKVAERLLKSGVNVLDIAGAGGTSWAKVEKERKEGADKRGKFNDGGIPTMDGLNAVPGSK